MLPFLDSCSCVDGGDPDLRHGVEDLEAPKIVHVFEMCNCVMLLFDSTGCNHTIMPLHA